MQQGPFAPRALPRFSATTDPAARGDPPNYNTDPLVTPGIEAFGTGINGGSTFCEA